MFLGLDGMRLLLPFRSEGQLSCRLSHMAQEYVTYLSGLDDGPAIPEHVIHPYPNGFSG